MKKPKSRRTFLQIIIACTAALISGCGGTNQTVVTVTGASTLLPVIERAARALEEKHPEYRFEVSGGGTEKGIQDVKTGFSQLGMIVARPLTPEEAAKFQVFAIATDGVAVVVHAKNPVTSISREQLRAIFTKQITGWESLGGGKGELLAINRGPGQGTKPVFASYLGLAESELKGVVAGNNSEVLSKIDARPEAVGFISLGEALSAIKKAAPIKILTLEGVAPTVSQVAAGTYPVQMQLKLISAGEPSAGARILIDYLGTIEGKQISADCSYVPAE